MISANFNKIDILARIGNIASNCDWVEQTLMDFHILQSDISQSHSGLGCAGTFFVERVKHAAWAISIWLLHLLRANIDCPPDRPIHCEVYIVYVLHKPIAIIARVCFHVNTFEWPDHSHVPKCNISYAVATQIGRHTSHAHTHS